jgi:hypothetical protein
VDWSLNQPDRSTLSGKNSLYPGITFSATGWAICNDCTGRIGLEKNFVRRFARLGKMGED